ncbi:MAG: HNH endonuclease signature motif containing protein, partial [Acidimicrobiales bacterium]
RATSAGEDRERHDAIHRSRYLRTWTDRDGAGRLDARLTPEALAAFRAGLAPFERQAFDAARRGRERERSECYGADALIAMARAAGSRGASGGGASREGASGAASSGPPSSGPSPDGPSPDEPSPDGPSPDEPSPDYSPPDDAPPSDDGAPGPPAKVIAVVDHAALVRGYVEGDECCRIEGLGPVPVSSVRAMMGDSFLAAVVRDGVDIRSVVHLGRAPTALQRSALIVRDPTCVVPGCDQGAHLEYDHCPPWAQTRHTTLDELARLCAHHHHLKTYSGWTLAAPPPSPPRAIRSVSSMTPRPPASGPRRPTPPGRDERPLRRPRRIPARGARVPSSIFEPPRRDPKGSAEARSRR